MVPEELRRRTQWLIWKFEQKKGAPKPAKMPYYASGKRRTGVQGSVEDMAELVSFDVAVACMSRLGFEGIGFAFLKDGGLIGIDIDGAIDPETGEISERAREIIKACDSYTELSPSKKGVHIFVQGDTVNNKSNDIGLEVFSTSQFFTYTGEHYSGTPTTVNAIDAGVLRRLHATINDAKAKAKAKAAPPAGKPGVVPIADSKAKPAGEQNDFQKVNDAAINNLQAWVPTLFPTAKTAPLGYRVPQVDLGRDHLQEDLSITTKGIIDYGVGDMGDPRQGKRTPIDLVIEWGKAAGPKEALHWLADQLGIRLAKLPGRKGKAGASGEARKTSREDTTPDPEDSGPPYDGPPPMDDRGGSSGDGGDFPTIEWRQGELPAIVNAAERALIGSDAGIFQRAGSLVRIVYRDTPSIRHYKRPPGTLGLHHIDQSYLVEELTRVAYWEKWDARADEMRRINAPKEVAATYLSRVGRWKVPPLWSVITAPTLRPDGSVLQTPGYDRDMATWYGPGRTVFPEVREDATHEDAEAALKKLRDTFATLPYESPVDEAVMLALVLTGLVRRSLPTSPIGGITAPDAGTGKTLLADSVAILATGAEAPAIKYPESDEEAAKSALAVLAEGDAVVLLDNVERPLHGDWLCSILTSESYRQRVLGRTEMMTVPTTTQWLATGNQLVFEGDLALRALMCRLDAKCERPDARVFNDDLRIRLARERPELVAAGLTVMRAYIATGQRMADFCTPWGRFEHWSEMVRAPLIWLGLPDPCESRSAIDGNDPRRGELQRMLAAWWAAFKDAPKTARDVIDFVQAPMGATGRDSLEAVLADVAQERDKSYNTKKLGKWLGRFIGRRVDGMHFVKHGKDSDHSILWKVESINKQKGAKTG